MNRNSAVSAVLAAGLLILAVAGCSDDDDDNTRLKLGVTDAPVDDATAVVIQFTGVAIKPQGGDEIVFDFDTPRSIDLLALTGGDSELLLDGVEIPAGDYNWVRLMVNAEEDTVLDSYITLDDASQHELEVPSGSETGLKLVSGFTVPEGTTGDFTVDFDLRKSITEPQNASPTYILKPVLRIVDNAEVGEIGGTVDAALITEGCTPAVYVYTGAGATPDDVDGTDPEPLTSALVELDTASGDYTYTAAFLSPGAYTVSFTCDAGADAADADDTLTFAGTQDATVVADETTVADFAPAP